MSDFTNRESTYKNRFKVINEDGTSFYATLERSDNASVNGTMITADILNEINNKAITADHLSNENNVKISTIEDKMLNIEVQLSKSLNNSQEAKTKSQEIETNVNTRCTNVETIVQNLNNKVSNSLGTIVTSNTQNLETFNADTKVNVQQGSDNVNKTLVVNSTGDLTLNNDLQYLKEILLKILVKRTDGAIFTNLSELNSTSVNDITLKIGSFDELVG